MLKARDVEEIIKNRGFERGTVHILSELTSRMAVVEKGVAEMAGIVDQLSTIVSNFTHVAHNMKQSIEAINASMDTNHIAVHGPNKRN